MLRDLKSSFPLRLSLVSFFFVLACGFFNFANLTHWDAEWYRQLVNVGYSAVHSADPNVEGRGNVGFFPGYPLACYLIKKILGFGSDALPTTAALVITANLFAILLWVNLEKWLALFAAAKPRAKTVLLALYPYCFFFYCAYTESMFVSMILGFFYYSEKWLREDDAVKARRYFWLAILNGFLMNLTRLVGLVLIFYPLMRTLQTGEKKLRAILIALGSATSTLLFLVYCAVKFGAWDFYFTSEKEIWNTYVDLHKLFPPTTLFDFSRPLHADTVSKYVAIGLGVYLIARLIRELKNKEWFSPAFALTLCSGMLWGEYLLGRTSWDFSGMGRYLIPIFALLLPFFKIDPKWNWKWILIGSVMLGFQIAYALKFCRHGWVA